MIEELVATVMADKIPYIEGPPGLGKTSVAKILAIKLAEQTIVGRPIRVAVVFLAQRAGNEIHGIPVLGKDPLRLGDKDYTVVEQAPPDYVVRAASSDDFWLVIFDELNQLTPTDAGQAMAILTERVCGGVSMDRDRIGFVAAGNPAEMSAGGWTLPLPLRRRLVVLKMTVTTDDFSATWAFPNNWGQPLPPIRKFGRLLDEAERRKARMQIATWVRKSPGLFDVPKDLAAWQNGFACPATLEDAADLVAAASQYVKPQVSPLRYQDVTAKILEGAIGPGNAADFLGFVESLAVPEVSDVLDDLGAFAASQLFVDFQDRTDLFYMFLLSLADHLRTLRREAVNRGGAAAVAAKRAWKLAFEFVYLMHSKARTVPADLLVLALATFMRQDIRVKDAEPPDVLLRMSSLVQLARSANIAGADAATL